MAFELPEAVTVSRQLRLEIPGKHIAHVSLSPDCISLINQGFIHIQPDDLEQKTIGSVHSAGKWIFIRIEPEMYLLLALETGGKILYHANAATLPQKSHLHMEFTDGTYLTVRVLGWGFIKAVPERDLAHQIYPGQLGQSPLDLTYESFNTILDGCYTRPIKEILLNQREIAGIGNGYLQDILFKAKVHPKHKAAELEECNRRRLYDAVQAVLSEAVRLGGSDRECNLYDQPGGYTRLMDGRMKDQPCPGCGTTIEKLMVLGSACYVCPSCQGKG
jgi:formamidopyrimidine-DNA glycosylase